MAEIPTNAEAWRNTHAQRRSPLIRALEPRMMFDAAAVETAVAVQAQVEPSAEPDVVEAEPADVAPVTAPAASSSEPDRPAEEADAADTEAPLTDSSDQASDAFTADNEHTVSEALADDRPDSEDLEDSGTTSEASPEGADEDTSEIPETLTAAVPGQEVVFVVDNLPDVGTLTGGMREGVEVVMLDSEGDGLAQMADYLDGRTGLNAIHVISHGDEGRISLGNAWLDTQSAIEREGLLQQIGQSLTEDGDILLYGCYVGADGQGVDFISALASSTGADVAASTNATGSAAMGGDWVLEAAQGNIETASLELSNYADLLVAFSDDFSTGIGSAVTSFTRTLGGVSYTFTFTADGNGGDFASDPGNGFGGSASINMLSTQPGAAVERVTIARTDGADFTFGSIFIDNAGGGETTSVQGYLNGFATGAAQTMANGASGTLNFGSLRVDQVQITSADFVFTTFDNFAGDTDAPNAAPTVANAIPDQNATEDSGFNFQFAANTFNDLDGNTLTYTAQQSGGGALPAWLSFNAATRTFSGTPANGDVGTVSIQVTADDGNGGTVTDTFDIVVANTNDAPTVANPIANQNATEDVAFNFQFASNTFNDVDVGDTLTYSAELAGGGALPGWLSFNAATRTFSGTPGNADVGTISIDVMASDGNGGTVTDTFNIEVVNTNDAPTVANAIPDQNATEDAAFSFQFAGNTFNDADAGDTLTYSAQLAGGGALPAWLSFDPGTRTFSGTPLNANVGTVSIDVIASDGTATATDTFDIVVANTNDAPTVANPISNQNATEDVAFNFQFASNTFSDVDVGDTLTYSAQLVGGGALPGWLSFNAATRTFSGTPAGADAGTLSVEVTANDGNGGTVTDTFDLVVTAVNDAPVVTAPTSISVDEDVPSALTGISFTDADAGSADVVVTFSVPSGTLSATSGSGVTVGGTSSALTLTGSVTDINSFISASGVSFTTAGNGTADVTLTIDINDGGNTGSGGALADSTTVTLDVTAVNDAPVNGVPGAQSVDQGGTLVFSSGNGNLISVSDVDAGSNGLEVTLTASNGRINLSGVTGLSFTTGTGTNDSTMTFVGTIADINNALNGLTFSPMPGFTGSASLQISTDDQGFSGSGGSQTDVDTIDIAVANTAAQVTDVSSSTATGIYRIGDTISIQVAFNEAVTVDTSGGTPTLLLETGGIDRIASYVAGSGSTVLTFSYTVQSGDSSADLDFVSTAALSLNGATIRDASASDALLTLPAPGAAGSLGANEALVIDGVRPTASIVLSDTLLGIGQTATATITFSEAVTGLSTADFTVANGTLSGLSSSDGGVTWTATLTPSAGVSDTTNLITLDNTGVADAAGNPGSGTTDSSNYAIDTLRPTASIVVADTTLAVGETSLVTVTFNEAVTGLSTADFTVANGTLSGLSSSDGGVTWTATLTPDASVSDTTNLITLDNTGVADAAGNPGSGTTDSNNYAVDTQAPSVVSVAVPADGTYAAGQSLDLTVNFTEAISVDTSGGTPRIAVTLDTGGTVYANYLSGSGSTALVFRLTVGSGQLDADGIGLGSSIEPNGGTLRDAAGNATQTALNGVGSTAGVLVEAVSPVASSFVLQGSPAANASSVTFVLTLSEPVTGLDLGDFRLNTTGSATGTLAAVQAQGAQTYLVTVSGISGQGSLGVVLPSAGSGVQDAAGNPLGADAVSGLHSVSVVSVARPQPVVDPVAPVPAPPVPPPAPTSPSFAPAPPPPPIPMAPLPLPVVGGGLTLPAFSPTPLIVSDALNGSSGTGDAPGSVLSGLIPSGIAGALGPTTLDGIVFADLDGSGQPGSTPFQPIDLPGVAANALNLLGGQEAVVLRPGQPIDYTVPLDVLMGDDLLRRSGMLVEVRQADGRPLPAWLRFDPATGRFSGTPPPGFSGTVSLELSVQNAQGERRTVTLEFTVQTGGAPERADAVSGVGSGPGAEAARPSASVQWQSLDAQWAAHGRVAMSVQASALLDALQATAPHA